YLRTVEALTGRVPIIYTYPNFWRTAMADSNQFHRYPLWIADYRGNPAPEVPGGWSTWTFWQTTDSGRVPGIHGNTDLNVYSGAQGDLAGSANRSGWTGSGKTTNTDPAAPGLPHRDHGGPGQAVAAIGPMRGGPVGGGAVDFARMLNAHQDALLGDHR